MGSNDGNNCQGVSSSDNGSPVLWSISPGCSRILSHSCRDSAQKSREMGLDHNPSFGRNRSRFGRRSLGSICSYDVWFLYDVDSCVSAFCKAEPYKERVRGVER